MSALPVLNTAWAARAFGGASSWWTSFQVSYRKNRATEAAAVGTR